MRIIFFLSFFLFVCTPLAASADPFSCAGSTRFSDDESRAGLVRVEKAFSGLRSMKSPFVQESYLASLDLSERSEGTMLFVKPGQMRWDYRSPEKQTFVLSDKTVWFYQEADEQVSIQDFSDVFLSDLPVAFLTGVGKLQERFVAKEVCHTESGVVFRLRPKASTSGETEAEDRDVQEFELLVEKSHFEPIGARVTDISGNRTTLLFQERERNVKVAKSAFELTLPKNVDIQDQRRAKSHPVS